jgi:hypothetical protein
VRHRVAIILGLRHTRGKVIGHRTQLDPGRQLRPDICVESGAGLLALQRFIDSAALIVAERLEAINGSKALIGTISALLSPGPSLQSAGRGARITPC